MSGAARNKKENPPINTRSRAYRQAEKADSAVAVCIIGTGRRVPREFGDNEGAHPMRIVLTGARDAEKEAVKSYNRGARTHPYLTLCHTWVRTQAHAERIRARLLEKIYGDAKAAEMLAGFADCEGWVAELLLGETVAELDFEVTDDEERVQRIEARARKGWY